MNATLIEASLSDHPMIQNMGRFYVYDMSRYCGLSGSVFDWSIPPDGLFECIDLKKYFGYPDRFAFLIKVGEETAGFALISKTGTSPDVDWNIGEFFVLAKFQGTGVGTIAAEQLFKKLTGVWEVAAMIENTGAREFWGKMIPRFTQGDYTETQKTSPEPTPHEMIVFRFQSEA